MSPLDELMRPINSFRDIKQTVNKTRQEQKPWPESREKGKLALCEEAPELPGKKYCGIVPANY